MDRRKFFKRLGITAVVAAVAPKLLAEETIQPKAEYVSFEFDYDGTTQSPTRVCKFGDPDGIIASLDFPILTYIVNGQEYKMPYLKAYKKPVEFYPGITVMFLPGYAPWAEEMIMLRDLNNDYFCQLTIKERRDTIIYCIPSKVQYTDTKPIKWTNG